MKRELVHRISWHLPPHGRAIGDAQYSHAIFVQNGHMFYISVVPQNAMRCLFSVFEVNTAKQVRLCRRQLLVE